MLWAVGEGDRDCVEVILL